MSRSLYFITHPDVVFSPDVPVARWPLSELGRWRMERALGLPWANDLTSVYSSTERKAVDGARVLADALGLAVSEVPDLGENDRSATGYLPPAEFEAVADAFFGEPDRSVRGWERAVDAQARIVRAVTAIAGAETSAGSVAIVSHGAVGTLLYCHLSGRGISRRWDQPTNGGGNYYRFTLSPRRVHSHWLAIDGLAPPPSRGGDDQRVGG
jgi:broad specificity phosphatase PhoE